MVHPLGVVEGDLEDEDREGASLQLAEECLVQLEFLLDVGHA